MRARWHRRSRGGDVALDEARDASRGEPAAATIDEHRVADDRLLSQALPVVTERIERDLADRHDALLPPLAEDAQALVLEIDVTPVETDELADANARRVERLDDRAIALGPRVSLGERAHQPF